MREDFTKWPTMEDWLNSMDGDITRRERMDQELGDRGLDWVKLSWETGFERGLEIMAALSEFDNASAESKLAEENADYFFRGISAGIAVSIIAAALLSVLL